jgi:hypothetical protein
MRKVRIEFMIQ